MFSAQCSSARRLGILDSQWMMAMRSLMSTTTRQLATVMSAGNAKVQHERTGPESVRNSWDVYAWIISSQGVVVVCTRAGDGLTERPCFGTTNEDLVQDGRYDHGGLLGVQAAIQEWDDVMVSVPFMGPILYLKASVAFS